jgi:hypothetical protein
MIEVSIFLNNNKGFFNLLLSPLELSTQVRTADTEMNKEKNNKKRIPT